ncbi:putative high mobility group B protein 11 [Rutidosis leptorrhynchoides]|uniref:putative high mobility group B protein 11 n=1 Tax=Rutidosis leptorrhynchoides TaxID=125765 RepID=UPI003A99E7A0
MLSVLIKGLKTSELSSSSLTAGKSPCTAEEMKQDDGFYQKLNKLNESSGLSLLFNFRDTNIDLKEFYTFVTERGGYHQVTKDGKWEDIASILNQKSQVPLTPSQLLKLYATILYSFEQAYYYRCPEKHSNTPSTLLESWDLTNFTGKRKHGDICYVTHDQFSIGEIPSKKSQYDNSSPKTSPACLLEEKKWLLGTPEKVKEMKKSPRVPHGSRNCYQMFSKMEGVRIRSIYGNSVNLHDMISRAWKNLSKDDKQPYIEASKRDKERFKKEMDAYEEHMSKKHNQPQLSTKKIIKFTAPTFINFGTSSLETTSWSHTTPRHNSVIEKVVDFGQSGVDNPVNEKLVDLGQSGFDNSHNKKVVDFGQSGFDNSVNKKVVDIGQSGFVQNDDDYHVALQPDDDDEIVRVLNESVVQKTVGLMKNARPNDPIFQINWDAYGD